MEPLISVTIPVYNVEKYLEKCLNSIINQTYKNLEIICINDGSTDNSGKILDEYAKIDKRIVVVHKENGGLVSARKLAISIATGEYIGIVDSDDWIKSTMYEDMFSMIKKYNTDVVSVNFYMVFDDYTKKYTQKLEGLYTNDENDNNIIDHMFDIDENGISFINQVVWNKLYRADIIKQYLTVVPDEIVLFEDYALTYAYLPYINSIYISRQCYYYYNRTNLSSLTSNVRNSNSNIDSTMYMYLHLKKVYIGHKNNRLLLKKLDLFTLKLYLDIFPIYENFEATHNMIHQLFQGFNLNNDKYGNEIQYILPYALQKHYISKRIIIYGAGKVGISYYKGIKNLINNEDSIGNIEIKYIVDKSKCGDKIEDTTIQPVSILSNKKEYDLIILAISNKAVAVDIENELINKYGIEKDIILWDKPLGINELILTIASYCK